MDIKQQLKQIAEIFDQKLATYWDQELAANFGFNLKQKELVKTLIEHAKEHNLRKAKRLRAALVYYGYLLGQESDQVDDKIYYAGMAVELVHTALLMHDDFMDQDEMRRGQPTTHKVFGEIDQHYGNAMAINIGDAVLTLGYNLLLRSSSNPELVTQAMAKLLKSITHCAYGQAFDVYLEKHHDHWQEADIIAVHQSKTSTYTYDNPLAIGAILAGLDQTILDILHDYAMSAGVAFQLQDDILGIFGDPLKTGKSANSDLLQGKGTLLIMKTFDLGSETHKQALLKVWGQKQATEADIQAAKQAMIDSGSLDYSRKISKHYAEQALEHIPKLKQKNLNPIAIDFLDKIAQYMINRDM